MAIGCCYHLQRVDKLFRLGHGHCLTLNQTETVPPGGAAGDGRARLCYASERWSSPPPLRETGPGFGRGLFFRELSRARISVTCDGYPNWTVKVPQPYTENRFCQPRSGGA